MTRFTAVISAMGLSAILAPLPARAQSFDLRPELTNDEFKELTAQLGSVLRSRPLGDAATLGSGKVDLGVEFAAASLDSSNTVWNSALSHATGGQNLRRSFSFPRVGARFGVSDRVDVGVIGGFAPQGKYGMGGADVRIALLSEAAGNPVSVSARPSLTFLIAPSEMMVGTVGVDLSVSRAFGPVSPYAGVAASSSGAIERSTSIDLDPVSAGESISYVGLSYRWRQFVVSADAERGNRVCYAVRVGTRF